MNSSLHPLYNGSAVPFADIPQADASQFLQTILDAIDRGRRIVSYFGIPGQDAVTLVCVLADKSEVQHVDTSTGIAVASAATGVGAALSHCASMQRRAG